jgi:hypothetical protein
LVTITGGPASPPSQEGKLLMTKTKTQALLTGVAAGAIVADETTTASGQAQGQLDAQIINKLWLGYCKFAARLHHKEELAGFLDALRAGLCNGVKDPDLFAAAADLAAAADGSLPVTYWGSAPSAEELGSPTWAAQRLAAGRTNQATTGRRARWQQGLARALGAPRSAGTAGSINPVHLQKSKLPLDELAKRLQQAMDRPGFQREWLDHRSSNYLPVRDGGISNKQITIMAGLISGRQEPRSFDESWAIATNWLATH